MNWQQEWPTEPGWYWFYYHWNLSERKLRLTAVEVKKIANGLAYVGMGTFLYPGEVTGLWQPIAAPELPEPGSTAPE